ncbi:hypothetical protein HDU78_002798 [Chytriomyces hyalinus]|nr:hypothetical protein HDU78_002798 [Chytriomyces hyalinus]
MVSVERCARAPVDASSGAGTRAFVSTLCLIDHVVKCPSPRRDSESNAGLRRNAAIEQEAYVLGVTDWAKPVYTHRTRKSRYSPLPSSEKTMVPTPSIPSSPPLPHNSRAVPKLCPVTLQVAPTVTSSTFVMAEPASPSTVSALSDTSSGGLFPPFQSGAEKCEAPRYHPIMSVSNLID